MNPREHIQLLTTCDLCGAEIEYNSTPVASEMQELLGVSLPISTVICRKCRFVFQPESFSDELLALLYERDASFAFSESAEDQPRVRACLNERQAVISAALTANGLAAGGSVLDIGGGRGECCEHLSRSHRVVVADATGSLPADPRIEKVSGLFSEQLREGSFDAVVMNHVLEHVFSPAKFLSYAGRVLRNDGILIVEVPFELYTPLVARHLGDWRHVVYFCRATLCQFIEKAGFRVQRVALENGCYGVRRLPVIRAVARKIAIPPPRNMAPQNSSIVIARDMLAPTVLMSMAKSVMAR